MVLNFKCIVQNTRLPRLDVVADPSNTKPTLFERKSLETQYYKLGRNCLRWCTIQGKPFMMGYNRADCPSVLRENNKRNR